MPIEISIDLWYNHRGRKKARSKIKNYNVEHKEEIIMTVENIRIDSVDKVKGFVEAVSKIPYNVKIARDQHVIDAKSLMGIFSLDTTKPVSIDIDCDSDRDGLIMELVKPYIAA